MKALLCYSGISLLCLHPAAFAAASFALPRSSGSGGVASASASSGDGAVAVLSASSRSSLSSWLASSHDKSDRRRRPSPLHYRAIDELDEESDPRMIKVKSRAPKTDWFGIPGGVKNLLASAAAGPQRDAGAESNTAAVAPVDKDLAPASIQPPRKRTAMNVKLIRVLLLNQLLILFLGTGAALSKLAASAPVGDTGGFEYVLQNLDSVLNWARAGLAGAPSSAAGGAVLESVGLAGIFSGSHGSIWDFSLDPDRVLLGIGGALPLLAVSHRIENSDRRAFANVNFSTIIMTMTLFGRRKEPPDDFIPENYPIRPFPTTPSWDVAVQSLYLSVVTALCEETVFRRFLPAAIATSTGSTAIALLGQAALFGLGHASAKSPKSENTIVVGLQFLNGLGNGLLYLLSGGDLVPCVVSHALYDFVTFFGTWISSNGQLEYAEQAYCEPLDADLERQVRAMLDQSGLLSGKGKLDPQLYRTIKRLFYVFDFDKSKALSLSEVRKGVAYMALEHAFVPPPQEQIDALFRTALEARKNKRCSTDGRSITEMTQHQQEDDRLNFADFLQLFLSVMGHTSMSRGTSSARTATP